MKQISLLAWLVLVLFSVTGLWRLASVTDYQLTGRLVNRVDTSQPVIALTFNDGPVPGQTEAILRLLADEQIRATFFLVGRDLQRYPHLLPMILAADHQVGNHGFSHQRLVLKTPSFIAAEIEQTDALLKAGGAQEPLFFRPPYGKKLWLLPKYLASQQKTTVTWDLAPENVLSLQKNRTQFIEFTVKHARPGSIIALHVMDAEKPLTLNALPAIIQGLKKRGFNFVTVSELLTLAPAEH